MNYQKMAGGGGTVFNLSSGKLIGEDRELPAGWYRIYPVSASSPLGLCGMSVFDYCNQSSPVHVADYSWIQVDGEWKPDVPALKNTPAEYVVPLWDGCVVIPEYSDSFSYSSATEEIHYNFRINSVTVCLEYIGPFEQSPVPASPSAQKGGNVAAGSFTASPGFYVVGVEIPAGKYSVTCSPESEWTTVSIYDEEDDLLISENMSLETGKRIGSIELLDGYTVKVSKGSAYFSAPSGIVFE